MFNPLKEVRALIKEKKALKESRKGLEKLEDRAKEVQKDQESVNPEFSKNKTPATKNIHKRRIIEAMLGESFKDFAKREGIWTRVNRATKEIPK